VVRSIRGGRGHEADQHAVWRDVEAVLQEAGVRAATRALREAERTLDAGPHLQETAPIANQLGHVFVDESGRVTIDS
jgi:hypothetical protein